ncbi:glucose-6-phosphate dehydrogenase [candidate division KSB1 bacterium]|nr:glucose-6-phosphate dehydrogenase [candidate division KSB1 bacterium]
MEPSDRFIIVIFGGSGDLTKRKLMPALYNLFQKNQLPDKFAIIGIGRTAFTDDSFREVMAENIRTYSPPDITDNITMSTFFKNVYYQIVDSEVANDYLRLKQRIEFIDEQLQSGGNYVYYLSTSPHLFQVIADNLGQQQMNIESNDSGWKRLVVEKPFGYDLKTAVALNNGLQRVFKENQIYRIDHYLGKETVQNILAFRFANGIFEPLWNRNYIHHVEITAAEKIGVEDRGLYYDGTGAVRDMVQNHLLQILATITMEPPSQFNAPAVRNEKIKIFESIRPITPQEVSKYVVRGQYAESVVRGRTVSGYRCEKNIKPSSRIETFVAIKMFIDNWRWGGVPFYIRTGKRLPKRITEVVIHFKKTPHRLFQRARSAGVEENQLIIRVQPNEGILLQFGMKRPGAGFDIENVNMDFHYKDLSDTPIPDAYERLLLDCLHGDATLYARADAVEACWSFITPILHAWKKDRSIKLFTYPAGSWGPKQACDLFDDPVDNWHYPCGELMEEGEYGEL